MKDKIWIIYKLTNLLNGLSYIGYTYKKFIKRIAEHTKADSYIGDALRKHEVKNFKAEVLWQVNSKKDACIVEKAAICAYKTQAPNGYNLTVGGENPPSQIGNHWNRTEESKEKNRQASKGNKYAEGYKHSKEAIEKTRQAHLGKKCPEQSERMQGNQNTKDKHWNWSEESKKEVQGKHFSKKTKLKMGIARLKYCLREAEQGGML